MERGSRWVMALLVAASSDGLAVAADRIRPIDPEIVLAENEPTGSTGNRQAVAGDDFGTFTVVWGEGARIDAANAVTPLAQLTSGSLVRDMAMHPSGRFVVATKSQSGYGGNVETTLSGRVFERDGTPATGEFQVQHFTASEGYYAYPRVGMDASGRFVVVWSAEGTNGASAIFARRFDAAATPFGEAFQVNEESADHPASPTVAVAPDGHFVVAWDLPDVDAIATRAFDGTGAAVGPDAIVSDSTAEYQFFPHLGADASGNFVVAWEMIDQREYPEPSDHGILARRLGPDGAPISDVMRLETDQRGDRGFGLAVDAGGGFLVAWNDYGRVKARAFDPIGAPRSRNLQVSTGTARYVGDPAVAAGGAGEFLVTWQDWLDYGGQTNHRWARRLGPPRLTATLRMKDHPTPARRKIVIAPGSGTSPSSFGRRIDPTADGAFLHVFNASGTGDSACIPLPASGWTAKGAHPATAPRFVYADPDLTNGPCAGVTVVNRKVVKATCRAGAHPISYGLDEPQQGSVAVRLVSGTRAWCSVFGADARRDQPGAFVASDGLPAGDCPAPPAPCP